MKNNAVKEVKLCKFVVCLCKSQDFAKSQMIFARSHDRETLTFRNSDCIVTKGVTNKAPKVVLLEFTK